MTCASCAHFHVLSADPAQGECRRWPRAALVDVNYTCGEHSRTALAERVMLAVLMSEGSDHLTPGVRFATRVDASGSAREELVEFAFLLVDDFHRRREREP